jgi:hypothetical protein
MIIIEITMIWMISELSISGILKPGSMDMNNSTVIKPLGEKYNNS